jgi:hypothetical protein
MSGDANFFSIHFSANLHGNYREKPWFQNTSANIFMAFPSAARETKQKQVFFKLL